MLPSGRIGVGPLARLTSVQNAVVEAQFRAYFTEGRDISNLQTLNCQFAPTSGSIPVAPPWENGFIESFHSRLRDEFLDREEFDSVADAQAKAGWSRREYNLIRPHSGIGYKMPQMFSQECDRGLHGKRPKKQTGKRIKDY